MNQQAFVMAWLSAVQAAVNAHIHEEGGNNLGPDVEKYQRACGGSPGESWCMYFLVYYALKTLAVQVLHVPVASDTIVHVLQGLWGKLQASFGILVTGSCGEQMQFQRARGRVIDRDDVTHIEPGWLCLWAWNQSDIDSRTPRHVSMCRTRWVTAQGGEIDDLEGNTSAGNPSDGDSTAEKDRSIGNLVCVLKTY